MKTTTLIVLLSFAVQCSALLAEETSLSSSSFTLTFSADGRPIRCIRKSDNADLVIPSKPSQGFYLKAGNSSPVRLPKISVRSDNILSVCSDDQSKEILFRINKGERSIAFRIEKVTGVSPEKLEELHFEVNSSAGLKALDLDYMTSVHKNNTQVHVQWPTFWQRSPENPLGGFVLYEKTSDDDEDQTLLNLWVTEKFPHPKVEGPWTIEKARQWIQQWQNRFADRGQLILEGKSIAELREGVEFAQRAGLKQIYLFTNTWRTDAFWPETDLNWSINRSIFPQGEIDMRQFSDFVKSKGMYLAFHYVSGGIGLKDPKYVGQKPDTRFASWGDGQLASTITESDREIILKPSLGLTPPAQRQPAFPHFFETKLIRIGNELIRFGTLEVDSTGVWKLKGCSRAQGSTSAESHSANDKFTGLLLAYGQNLIPDNNSTLIKEIAENYASLLNRCGVEHAEFDGAEIHAHEGRWGYQKFATLMYQTLDHPTTAHDSGARQPACWFEYRLNSSQRLMRGSCGYSHGNYSVPVCLYNLSRPATTLLDAHFTLSQGNYGGAMGFSKPEPMFGVLPQTFKSHGLTDQFVEALTNWRQISKILTDEQREKINSYFSRPKPPLAQFNRHLISPAVLVAQKTSNGYEIIPTNVLMRKSGDIYWQHGQEHGAISPRQYIKPNETIELNNPNKAQEAQWILHLLPAFNFNATAAKASAGSGPKEMTDTEVFTGGNQKPVKAADTKAVSNVSLHPNQIKIFDTDCITKASMENNAVVLAAANTTTNSIRETEKLPYWKLATDMSRRRGVGMWITGDNSGALLLIKLRQRDYIVPINFKDRRYIEIPNGEVSWASSYWGWRMSTKSTNYSDVQSVQMGFGEIPPNTSCSIKVEQLTALGEIPTSIINPVIHAGKGSIAVNGTIQCGQFLQYTSGDHAVLYDENWNRIKELPVVKGDYMLSEGESAIKVNCDKQATLPWIELQMITTGEPLRIKLR